MYNNGIINVWFLPIKQTSKPNRSNTVKQLIIVSDYHHISDIIKNSLIFESYDPIVLSSLEEAVKAFNRGRFEAILFVDYQNDDKNLDVIINAILEKTKKTVIMEYIYSKPAFDTKIIGKYENLHLINKVSKPDGGYDPQPLIPLLRKVFKQDTQQGEQQGSITYKNFTLNLDELTLTVNGKNRYITPAQCNLLAFFINNQGAVISKTDLILEYLNKNDIYIWSEYLDLNVERLQNLIGDNPKKPKVIKLIEGIGYYITPEKKGA